MKQAIQLGVLSAANICISFIFQLYILMQLGPGIETDALFAGMTLPQLFLTVISGSLMHILVPLLTGESKERIHKDAWGFFILVGGLFGFISCALYITAQWWIPLTVKGFEEEAKTLTIELTRIQLLGMVLAAINGVQWAVYHARRQFVFAELTPFFSGIISFIILVLMLPNYGVLAAAWINVLRLGIQTLLLMPIMGKLTLPDLRSKAISEAWSRFKPMLLGSAYYKTDPLIDRYFLSFTSGGNLSLYYFAQQILSAINQVINKAISAPLVPLLSSLYKEKKTKEFRQECYKKATQVSVIALIGILFLLLFGIDILRTLVGHGSINDENIYQMYWILVCLSGVFVGGAVGQIFSCSFYATGDTKTVVKLSIITYTIYIPSKIIAFYMYGITGLAVTTSLLYLADCFLMLYLMHKKQIWNHSLEKF